MGNNETKIKKPISSQAFMTAFGIFLCLLVFILVLDIWYFARALNFIPVFLFGYGEYFIYLMLLVQGIMFIFSPATKGFRFKKISQLGFFIILLGLSLLFSLIFPQNFNYATWNDSFFKLYDAHNYFKDGALFPFTAMNGDTFLIGGGLFGYSLDALMINATNNMILAYIVSIFVLLVGLIIVFFPLFMKIRKLSKAAQEENKRKQEAAVKASINNTDELEREIMFKPTKEKKPLHNRKNADVVKDVIASASSLEIVPESTSSEDINKKEALPEPTTNVPNNNFYNANVVIGNGGLKKAHFYKDGVPVNTSNNQNKVEEEITPQEEIKMEQTHFDFGDEFNNVEEKVEPVEEIKVPVSNIDSEIVRQKPVFVNPNEEAVNVVPAPKIIKTDTSKKDVSKMPLRENKAKFIPVSNDLLVHYDAKEAMELNIKTDEERSKAIDEIFKNFDIGAHVEDYIIGPSITRYNIRFNIGVSNTKISKYVSDISQLLGGLDVRFVPVVPGLTTSGLEVPNAKINTVGFKEMFEGLPDRDKHLLAVGFGKNVEGTTIYADFDEFPHLLVAGTTGSGKSIYVHSLIMSLIMRTTPDDLRIALVDPKKVEMNKYIEEPHLLCPIITEADECLILLQKLVDEMNDRYSKLSEAKVSNIKQYNKLVDKDETKTMQYMKYIIVFIDEYADMFDSNKEIAKPAATLAAKSRAAGIHLCIATQRPSVNVINGVLKGNLPTRVALSCASISDSMVVINEGGAEKLLGKGDMLAMSPLISRTGVTRLQGCFVSNDEIDAVVSAIKETYPLKYDENYLDLTDHSKDPPPMFSRSEGEPGQDKQVDTLYEDVKAFVMMEEFASISKIQRQFSVGFNRAGRLFSQLQSDGIVESNAASKGNAKGCRVLIHDAAYGDAPDIASDESSTLETLAEYKKHSDDTNGGPY